LHSHVRADTAVQFSAQVAVKAKKLELRRELALDDIQVNHGPAAYGLAVNPPTAVHVVDGQEATIGLSTASTACTVSVQHLILEAIMISPPPGTNSVRISCHLRCVASSGLNFQGLFVTSVVIPLVSSIRCLRWHSATILEYSLLSSQDAVTCAVSGFRR
jgi:hypothetical protein